MWQFIRNIYYSFPVQLVFLHLKRFQVLLIFWFILFSTVNGTFMKSFGANSLYLAPEYLGNVTIFGAAIVGVSIGIFIMSWNITTFILFSRYFRFLATTSNPFLKYCINNFVLPLIFLLFYFYKAVHFQSHKELMSGWAIFIQIVGFLFGFILIIAISLLYFFRADKTISRRMNPVVSNPQLFKAQFKKEEVRLVESRLLKVKWYLNSPFSVKKVRDVSHYSRQFVETIFSRHHFAAVLSIFIAFVFLIIIGYSLDSPFFQLPAAAGITIFFAILIAVSGAFSYFLQSWSIPFVIVLFFIVNLLYQHGVIDPSNKAYGLNYTNPAERPAYDQHTLDSLCTPDRIARDKKNMIGILENWKRKQQTDKPIFFIINVSGGGTRSATFTMNVLQRLDSLADGRLMDKTFLITGASGGMLGAAYFRQLYREKEEGKIATLQNKQYVDDISKDLLNPLFTSFVARDLASPAQKFNVGQFEYVKDRGYAFEQKLSHNTHGALDGQLKDLAADEQAARIPLMFFNSVITRDGRKMVISTQPVSFMMKPLYDSSRISSITPDAVDFGAFFARQDPMDLRLLTALRMNATFPYVLPNVWLPCKPVIDVMDAGLRDNFGQETAIRFVQAFQDWLEKNTGGVVLLQVRDRQYGGWEYPYESDDISEIVTKPLLLLQYNWYKMQEYNQNDLLSLSEQFVDSSFYKLSFLYLPQQQDSRAALNFHLSKREKQDIAEALDNKGNQQAFALFQRFIHTTSPAKQVVAAGKP